LFLADKIIEGARPEILVQDVLLGQFLKYESFIPSFFIPTHGKPVPPTWIRHGLSADHSYPKIFFRILILSITKFYAREVLTSIVLSLYYSFNLGHVRNRPFFVAFGTLKKNLKKDHNLNSFLSI
jgi:hypothetical protein